MSNKTTKKSPGIGSALFNCTGEIGMDRFSCLNSSFSLCYSYFVTNPRKKEKFMAYVRLQLKLSPSPPPPPARPWAGRPFWSFRKVHMEYIIWCFNLLPAVTVVFLQKVLKCFIEENYRSGVGCKHNQK